MREILAMMVALSLMNGGTADNSVARRVLGSAWATATGYASGSLPVAYRTNVGKFGW